MQHNVGHSLLKVPGLFAADKTSFSKLINLLLFQAVWFVTVLGAAAGNGWIGLIGLTVFFVTHQLTFDSARADFMLAGLAVLIAACVETLIVQTGLLSYKAAIPFEGLAPLWLLVLWANFALTMNGCIDWLHGRYALAAALGAIGGPLSYFGGLKLGAATTDKNEFFVLACVAIVYAIVTPLLFYFAQQFSARTKKPGPHS